MGTRFPEAALGKEPSDKIEEKEKRCYALSCRVA